MYPRLIIFEGTEAVGKTTQIDLLENKLITQDISYIRVKCPGTTPTGVTLRTLLLDGQTQFDPVTKTLLFLSSIMDLLNQKIMPALEEDKIVLCDRLFDTLLVYQGIDDDLTCMIETLIQMCLNRHTEKSREMLHASIIPIYMLCHPTTTAMRVATRSENNINDTMSFEALTTIYDRYSSRIRSERMFKVPIPPPEPFRITRTYPPLLLSDRETTQPAVEISGVIWSFLYKRGVFS